MYGVSKQTNQVNENVVGTYNSIYGSVIFTAKTEIIKKIVRKDNDIDGDSGVELYSSEEKFLDKYVDLTCENLCSYTYEIDLVGGDTVVFSGIDVEFEDIILCDAASYNLIRFNPSLGSMKLNQSESITPTLGGRYPVIRRNAATCYYSFSLGGLISIRAEDELCLLPHTNYSEIAQEINYRKQFVDFLTNGKMKLFKSPTEGVMLVRITGVSLTPEQKLSRMVYNFSATVTEAAEATIDNCIKYNIYSFDAKGVQLSTIKGQPFYVKKEGE